jgi:hypothetical protein
MIASELRTPRLTLIPATADHVRAALDERRALGEMLGVAVPASWPPGEYDEAAQQFFLGCLTSAGSGAEPGMLRFEYAPRTT